MSSIIVAYVPVLHEGYRKFFEHHGSSDIYILDTDIISEFAHLSKEIRQLAPELIQKAIQSWGMGSHVQLLSRESLEVLASSDIRVIMPDEDVSRSVADKYFCDQQVVFDTVFLRWDRHNALKEKPVIPDEMITRDAFHRCVMAQAEAESAKSSDIWRHVGAVVAKEGQVLMLAHNKHVPSEHMPYAHGDPRNNFHKGENIEFSTALHAEAGLIAEAARRGLSLLGADLYVTVFPCPPCAKLVAYSGIKTLYCAGGYAVLDGEEVLKSQGVKIVFVE